MLLSMLLRFLKAEKEMKMAVIDIGKEFDLTHDDLDKIKELCSTLAPLNGQCRILTRKTLPRRKLGESE